MCILILLSVLILLHMCPDTTVYKRITELQAPHILYVSSYYYICVLILLYTRPQTSICVLILLYMCPHTTIYVSSFYCVEAHHGAAGTRFTCFTSTTEQSLTPEELLCVEQVLSLLALMVPKYKY
jgi:hypothetical protein